MSIRNLTRDRRLMLAVLSIALAGGCAVYAFLVEPARLVLRTQAVRALGLPSLRLGLLSDLHAGAPFIDEAKIRLVVDRMNAGKPDLIFLLGDYLIGGRTGNKVLGGQPMPPAEIGRLLAGLRAPRGVFAVLGNHDWWTDAPGMRRALAEARIQVLDDQAVKNDGVGGSVWLAGIADQMEGNPDPQKVVDAIPPGEPILAFTHNPDVFPRIPARVALTLAGHTHGGQVWLPFVGALIVPSRHGQRYVAGLVAHAGHQIFVTTGIGTSILPVRFGVPPEIVFLEINR